MAGPWEDYQSAAQPSGPWNDYSTWKPMHVSPKELQLRAETYRLQHRVTADQSFGQNLVQGAGKVLTDTALGVRQLTGFAGRAEADRKQAIDEDLNATGGGIVGQTLANVATMVVPAGAAVKYGGAVPGLVRAGRIVLNPGNVTTARGLLPALARAGTAGGIGAVNAFAQPVGTNQSRAFNTGAGFVVGSGAYAAPGTATAIVNGIRNLRAPLAALANRGAARILAKNIDPESLAVIRSGNLGAVDNQAVPGSQPGLAEVLRDPKMAALDRTMRTDNRVSSLFSASDEGRNAARNTAIEDNFHGASPQDVERLKGQANDIAGQHLPDIMRAHGAGPAAMNTVRALDRLANNPQFRNFPETQRFLTTARDMIAQPISPESRVSAARSIVSTALKAPVNTPVPLLRPLQEAQRIIISGQRAGAAPEAIIGELKGLAGFNKRGSAAVVDAIRALRTAESGKDDVASLYNARQHITQELLPNLGGKSLIAARSFLKNLDSQITAVAPTFKKYLTDFSAQMRLADQAKVGNSLLETGRPAPSSHLARFDLGAGSFNKRTVNMDNFIRGVTGFGRSTEARALTPQQIAAKNAVRQDLDSFAWSQHGSRASKNSITAEAMAGQKAMAAAANDALNALPGSHIAGQFLSGVRQQHGERVANLVAQSLLNPSEAQRLLSVLPPEIRVGLIRQVAQLSGQGYGQTKIQNPRLQHQP